MRYALAICASFLISTPVFADGQPGAVKEITEEDGSPSCFGYQAKFANGSVTDNNDGSCSVAGGSGDVTAVGDCTTGACFDGSSGTTLTFNDAGGDQTIIYNSGGDLDFNFSDDLNINDGTPHLRWIDTTANHRDFESYADANQWYLTDYTNGTILLNWTASNALKFRGSGVNYSWPTADGSNTNVLQTNGSGVLSWAAAGAGSGDITSVGDVASGAAFDGTAGTALTIGVSDPADAGVLRLENAATIAWEASPAGTDETLTVNAAENFVFTDSVVVDASDPADTGAIRFDNAEGLGWEASPAGTDCTLLLDSGEILQSSCAFNTGGVLSTTGGLTIDGTTESNAEAALDIGGEVTSTGMASTVVADSLAVSSWNLTTPTITTSATFGATGVVVADDADGALEFLGAGTGADECLALNLDDTSNQAVFGNCAVSTSITDVTFSSIDITVGGGNINTGNIALTVGDATTDTITLTTDGTGTGEVVLPDESISTAEITNATITTTDISGSAGITAAQTALTAGRSLTFSTNDILADVELYTETHCHRINFPTAGDDDKSVWFNGTANQFTATNVWGESDQTVTFMLQVDDGTPADMDSVDLAPAAGTAQDSALNGDATIAAGDRVDVDIASVSGSPTWVEICFTGSWDD